MLVHKVIYSGANFAWIFHAAPQDTEENSVPIAHALGDAVRRVHDEARNFLITRGGDDLLETGGRNRGDDVAAVIIDRRGDAANARLMLLIVPRPAALAGQADLLDERSVMEREV